MVCNLQPVMYNKYLFRARRPSAGKRTRSSTSSRKRPCAREADLCRREADMYKDILARAESWKNRVAKNKSAEKEEDAKTPGPSCASMSPQAQTSTVEKFLADCD